MNPRLLEYFLRVAEFGSINRAASDLRVSQPALSRHLAALEHEVGTLLFVRDSRGVRLTDAGSLLAERARPILRQIELLRGEMGRLAISQVAIALPPSLQRRVSIPFSLLVVQDLPHIALRVYEGMTHAVRDLMAAGLVDMGVMAFQPRPLGQYEQVPLAREPLFLVGERESGLRLDAQVPLVRLAGIKLILPGRPNAIRLIVENSLRRSKHAYKSALEVETLALCLELAKQGIGYTVMPYSAIFEHPDAGAFAAAPVRGLYITWALHVSHAREHATAVRQVRAVLEKVVRDRLSSGAWHGAEAIAASAVLQVDSATSNGRMRIGRGRKPG